MGPFPSLDSGPIANTGRTKIFELLMMIILLILKLASLRTAFQCIMPQLGSGTIYHASKNWVASFVKEIVQEHVEVHLSRLL